MMRVHSEKIGKDKVLLKGWLIAFEEIPGVCSRIAEPES